MKTAFLVLAIFSMHLAEEIPIPQGPGVPIDQLGSQVLVEGNYRDITAWNVHNLSADQEGVVEQIQKPAKIITERLDAAPRVLTQTIRTQPKVITETIEAPIRQKIITQPTVVNVYEQAQPHFLQGQDKQVTRSPVYLPAQYKNEVVQKYAEVPGNTVTNRTYIQPVNRLIREEVQVQQAPEVRRELQPIYKDTQVQNNSNVNYVQVPSQKIYSREVVQPIYNRENVQLQILDSQPRHFNNEAQVLGPQFEDSTRVQSVNVPARTVYTQQQHQPVVYNEKVQLKFQNSAPVHRTNEAIVLTPQVQTDSQMKKYPVTHTIPQFYNHPVEVPVVHHVPVYKDIPVEVVLKEPEDNVMDEVQEIQDDIAAYWDSQRSSSYGRYMSMSSSDDYNGRRMGHGMRGHHHMNDKDMKRHHHMKGKDMKRHHYHHMQMKQRLQPAAYDISDLYHQ